MAKPSELPRWSTDADYPAGPETYAGTPTITDPVSGRKDEGWEPGKKPPAQEMNWLFNLIYQWLKWIDDGVWTAVSLVLTGALTVVDVVASGIVTVTGHVTASEYYHTDPRTIVIPASAAVDVVGSQVRAAGHITINGNTDVVVYPIILPDGCIIEDYQLVIDKKTANTNTVAGYIFSTDDAGTEVAESAGFTDSGNSNHFAVIRGETDVDLTITIHKEWYFVFIPGGGNTPAPDIIYGLKVTYTRPPP